MAEPPHTQTHIVKISGRPKRLWAGVCYRLRRLHRRPVHLPPEDLLRQISNHDPNARQLSFTFSLIALAARVACADGPLTHRKYLLFRESFPLREGMCSKIRSLFILACYNDTPLAHYIMQIKYAYPGQKELFASLLDRLFRIATADGSLSVPAEDMLAEIADGLDISAAIYSSILAHHLGPRKPHQILGVHKDARRDTIKSRYRELMRQYHPDRFAAGGLSEELELLLQLKASEINEAYHAIARRAA